MHIKENVSPSLTDRSEQLSADEFVWDESGSANFHQRVLPLLESVLRAHGCHKILDMGCGNGALTGALMQRGFQMTGIDGSHSGIEIARSRWPSITFEKVDICQPLPEIYHNQFDAVVSVEVIEHLLLPRLLIDNALLAMRPGASLVITTPYHGYLKNLAIAALNGFDTHWHPLRDFGHIKFFSKRTLGMLLKEYPLTDVQFKTVGRIPSLAHSMFVTARCDRGSI
jgi:2-polyprenyl-6-hydroxyphenyl methylase/3-demethylubiquinone-9 3-methyltransferase